MGRTFLSLSLASLPARAWVELEAGERCLAAPPPNLPTFTPHFSLFLGFIFPLESIAWVNVCPAVRCVFYSCREDKRGAEKRPRVG